MSFTDASDSDTSVIDSNKSIFDSTGEGIVALIGAKSDLDYVNPAEVKPQYYYHPYAER